MQANFFCLLAWHELITRMTKMTWMHLSSSKRFFKWGREEWADKQTSLDCWCTPQFKLFTWGNCVGGGELCTSTVEKKSLDQLGSRRAEWQQREVNVEQRNLCFWWAKMRSSNALLCVVSPKHQGRLSKKSYYWLQTLGAGSSFPSSLSIPICGPRAPWDLGEWHRLVILLYAAVSRCFSIPKQGSKETSPERRTVPAHTIKTKGEREF